MDPEELKIAQKAIEELARRDGVSVAHVRERMTHAMLESLRSADPAIGALWAGIPSEGLVPTPEEFILHAAGLAAKRGEKG